MMAGPEVPGGASPDEPEAAARLTAPPDEPQAASRLTAPPDEPVAAARLTAPSDEPQAASRLEGPSPEQPEAASRARPPRRRRALRALSTLLIVAGALVLADGAATLVWQEPVTAVYARVQQERLEDELAALEQTEPAPAERRALVRLPDPRRRLGFAARALARRSEAGDPVGRLRVPAIGLRTVVVQGTGAGELRSGPGHYPGTPLPGQRGTVAIAGHRTTYGAPFRHVDDLARGDRIELDMPYGRFTYRVERTRVVPATAIDVVDRVAYDRLVLTACHPLYSAAERIVVFARLAAFR